MLISEQWLREWVALELDTGELAARLTMAGLEVGGISRAGPDLRGVLVGKIVRTAPHPQGDRLLVCEVDAGRSERITVVCGAANARPGLRAPLALPGAELPGGQTIHVTNVRGVTSAGMLCAAAELGLETGDPGLMELDRSASVGGSLSEVLRWDDNIIEIDLTPNRGDCLSVMGIARELSVLTGARIKRRSITAFGPRHRQRIGIQVQAPESCPRYVGQVVRNLDPAAATPLWMRERLRRCGLRPINPVVDVTNYVLLELGQPMHAFDRAVLSGDIVVRMARRGEMLVTLDGNKLSLEPDTLVIADQQRILALAGIMGGEASGVSGTTTDVVLESAHFTTRAMAGRARRYGLATDSSFRFERGVDPSLPEVASRYAGTLLARICGGEPGPVVDRRVPRFLPRRSAVTIRHGQAERVLGKKLDPRRMHKTLARISSSIREVPGGWSVTPPTFRFDIERECDLVEEIARIDGYETIAAAPPLVSAPAPIAPDAEVSVSRIRKMLVDRDYQEIISYSFVDPALQATLGESVDPPVGLANPLADNLSVMRTTLLPGLVAALMANRNRQQRRVRLFEIGNTFHRTDSGVREVARIGGVVCGPAWPRQWAATERDVDFFDIKADLEALLSLTATDNYFIFNTLHNSVLHPGRAARIGYSGGEAGYVGQLHPAVAHRLELDETVYVFECELDAVQGGRVPHYRGFSRYPSVRRDLAVVVDAGTPAREVLEVVRAAVGAFLTNLELFDEYRGEAIDFGRKSLAFTLTLQHSSRTLNDAEVDTMIETARRALKDRFGAEFRS